MSLRAKRQGTIEPPREAITATQERVTVGNRTMYITTFTSKFSVSMYIGSKTIYCIDIHLYKSSDDQFEPIGELNKIRWDNQCSIDDSFEHGTDTMMILELAMTLIHKRYPNITHIRFTDMSSRKCDNGTDVDLAAMKYFTDGRTWYEDRFHAVIDPRSETTYEKMIRDANAIKSTMTWQMFTSYAPLDTLKMNHEHVEKVYEASDTWQEFFSAIRDEIGKGPFCVWLSQKNWFDNFVRGKLRFHLMSVAFLLDVSRFHIDFQLESNHAGGFRSGIQRWTTTRRKKHRRAKHLM